MEYKLTVSAIIETSRITFAYPRTKERDCANVILDCAQEPRHDNCFSGRVLDRKKRYLALQMVKDGKWGLPAGKVEHREHDKKALEREMREEIGSEITILYPIGIYRFISDRGNDIINIEDFEKPLKSSIEPL